MQACTLGMQHAKREVFGVDEERELVINRGCRVLNLYSGRPVGRPAGSLFNKILCTDEWSCSGGLSQSRRDHVSALEEIFFSAI